MILYYDNLWHVTTHKYVVNIGLTIRKPMAVLSHAESFFVKPPPQHHLPTALEKLCLGRVTWMLQKPYLKIKQLLAIHIKTCNKFSKCLLLIYFCFISDLLWNNDQVVSISSLIHKEWKNKRCIFIDPRWKTKPLGENRRTKQRSAKGRFKRPEIIDRNGCKDGIDDIGLCRFWDGKSYVFSLS